MTRRVLVTGGAGFIGSHIVDLLIERGLQPVVLDNESTGRRENVHPEAEFVHGDVRDEAAVEGVFGQGVDAVMHIAGQASIRLSYMDPAADLSVNTLGTINVLQASVKYGISRLLFASSMTVYGDAAVIPIPEDCPPAPVSYYAVTKWAAERYVHLTAQRPDLNAPLHVTSFRMFNVYGERQSLTNSYQGVLAIFIGAALRGEPITIHADGEQTRDFVHVSDVARAWVDALDAPASYGQVMNLGTGVPCSVNTLCDTVLTAVGRSRASHAVRYAPAQPGDMRASAGDISRARALLGWEPRVALADGLAQTVEWARQQNGA